MALASQSCELHHTEKFPWVSTFPPNPLRDPSNKVETVTTQMETVQTKPQGEGRSIEAISQLAWSLHYAVLSTRLHILAMSIGNTFFFFFFFWNLSQVNMWLMKCISWITKCFLHQWLWENFRTCLLKKFIFPKYREVSLGFQRSLNNNIHIYMPYTIPDLQGGSLWLTEHQNAPVFQPTTFCKVACIFTYLPVPTVKGVIYGHTFQPH